MRWFPGGAVFVAGWGKFELCQPWTRFRPAGAGFQTREICFIFLNDAGRLGVDAFPLVTS